MPNVTITIAGNLTADPELRFTPGGHAVANFTVAYTPRERSASGEWSDGDVQFWRVSAWRNLAENIAESLVRGDPVIVTGVVKFREYVSREGEKKHSHEIAADSVGVSLAFHTVRVRRASRRTEPAIAADTADTADATDATDTASEFAGK